MRKSSRSIIIKVARGEHEAIVAREDHPDVLTPDAEVAERVKAIEEMRTANAGAIDASGSAGADSKGSGRFNEILEAFAAEEGTVPGGGVPGAGAAAPAGANMTIEEMKKIPVQYNPNPVPVIIDPNAEWYTDEFTLATNVTTARRPKTQGRGAAQYRVTKHTVAQ